MNIGNPKRRLVTNASIMRVVSLACFVLFCMVSASAPDINPYFSPAIIADTSSSG